MIFFVEMEKFFQGITTDPMIKELLEKEYKEILAEKALENLKKRILEDLKKALENKLHKENNNNNSEAQEEEKNGNLGQIPGSEHDFEIVESIIKDITPKMKDSIPLIISVLELVIPKKKKKTEVIPVKTPSNNFNKKFVMKFDDGKWKLMAENAEAGQVKENNNNQLAQSEFL